MFYLEVFFYQIRPFVIGTIPKQQTVVQQLISNGFYIVFLNLFSVQILIQLYQYFSASFKDALCLLQQYFSVIRIQIVYDIRQNNSVRIFALLSKFRCIHCRHFSYVNGAG